MRCNGTGGEMRFGTGSGGGGESEACQMDQKGTSDTQILQRIYLAIAPYPTSSYIFDSSISWIQLIPVPRNVLCHF